MFQTLPAGPSLDSRWRGIRVSRWAGMPSLPPRRAFRSTSAIRPAPWQRGSNENARGLLHQCFPKGSHLSMPIAEDLTAVAAELNNRPRKILGWDTPARRFTRLLVDAAWSGIRFCQ